MMINDSLHGYMNMEKCMTDTKQGANMGQNYAESWQRERGDGSEKQVNKKDGEKPALNQCV